MGNLRAGTLKSSVLASVPAGQLTNAVAGAGGSTFLSASMAAPWGLLELQMQSQSPAPSNPVKNGPSLSFPVWLYVGMVYTC